MARSSDRGEMQGIFRTGVDTKSAGVASFWTHDVSLFATVDPRLDLPDERQRCAIGVGENSDFEDVIRTNSNAVFLRFTSIPIDHGGDFARLALAGLGCGSLHGFLNRRSAAPISYCRRPTGRQTWILNSTKPRFEQVAAHRLDSYFTSGIQDRLHPREETAT